MIKLSRTVAAAAAVLAAGAGTLTWAVTSASASTTVGRSVVHTAAAAKAAPALKALPGVIPRCSPSQLAVWVNADSADGTAGTSYYHLEFTNTGRTTCHLYSWPGVSARNLAGQQLGAAAARSGLVPATYVNIGPGSTAHSLLGYVDVQVTPECKPTTASLLKVYPPDDSGARHAFFSLHVCTTKVKDLTISRVAPGI
jgi:hypothetical protein